MNLKKKIGSQKNKIYKFKKNPAAHPVHAFRLQVILQPCVFKKENN